MHFHARTTEGASSYDPEWYAQSDALIRAQCDLVLNHTTARREGVPVKTVTRYLLETPNPVEMVSLNPGQGLGGRPWAREGLAGLRYPPTATRTLSLPWTPVTGGVPSLSPRSTTRGC